MFSALPLDSFERASSSSPAVVALRNLKNKKNHEHLLYLWFTLAGVIGFFTFIRLVRCSWERLAIYAEPNASNQLEKLDSEKNGHQAIRSSTMQRIARAVSTGFRIIFFRWSVRLLPGFLLSISEMTFICCYVALNFVLLFVDTMKLSPMFYQDRAADLAASQLALVVALAGKNNLISFLTGIGHEKLNVLHRAAARTLFVMLWIHALQRTVSGLPAQWDFTHNFMRAGVTALAALTLIAIGSIRPIRNAAFEIFLVSHIVLILIFLICGYYHTKQFQHTNFVYPALIVWAFDRFVRLSRIIWINIVGSGKHASDALVELLAEDTVRLTIRRRGVTWKPGQHAYLILPTISKLPFEAHPFTIASIPELINDQGERDLVFLIRGRGGFTGLLRKHASLNHESRVPAFVDGPYGCPPKLRLYSTCVLIAGGSGVSYTLPLLLDLIRAHKVGETSIVKRIVFVWALRDPEHLKWVSKTLMKALSGIDNDPSLFVETKIYVTGVGRTISDLPELAQNPQERKSTGSLSEKKDDIDDQILPTYSSLKVIHGRPSVKKLLHEEIEAAVGPISVDVAGPSGLAESVRRALCTDLASPASVLKGAQPVTLHVETFGMVKK